MSDPTLTPPQQLKLNRQRWSEGLRQAAWWIEQARKEAKKRNYEKSRSDTLMACFVLDNTCQFDTKGGEE